MKFFKDRKLLNKRKIPENEVEADYEKNMDTLRRKLIIRLISGIFGTSLLLLFVFTMVSTRSIDSMLVENFITKLNMSRDERVISIEEYYRDLGKEMERGTRSYTKEGNRKFISESLSRYREKGVEEVALFSGDYKVIYQSTEGEKLSIKKEIKSLRFQKPFYVNKITIENDITYQHIYYKFFQPGGNEYYLYFKLNNSYLNKILSKSIFQEDILNNEFYVVASNRELESTEYVINDISKKMLSGRVGMESFKGKLYSYSFIELGETSVYLQVYEDEEVYKAPLSRYKTKILLLWIIAMAGTLTVVVFIRLSIESYSVGTARISVEREGDKEYKFLKKELIHIFDDLYEIESSLHKLDTFTKNLDVIKSRIISQNKYFLKKVKEDEKLIDRISSDEELKKKIKDKL